MDILREDLKPSAVDRAMGLAIWFVLGAGLILRVTNLGILPPFLDETSGLKAALDYDIHPVMERLFLGKYLGYLLQRPVIELANDPLWAGRALSGVLGLVGVVFATWTLRRLAGNLAGLVCAILLGLNPQLVFHDRLALPESFGLFFGALSGLMWLLGRQRDDQRFVVLAGAAAACACATKIYTAPLFLFLPALAAGLPGGLRAFFQRDLRPLVLGFIGAGALILLSALDHSWAQHLSWDELLRMPKMIAGGSAGNIPPLGARLANAGGLLSGYLPITFWLLFVSTFLPGPFFRRGVIGCLVLTAITFFLYGLIFRTFVAARYFNGIWLPAVVAVSLALATPTLPGGIIANHWRLWFSRVQLGLLAVVAIQFSWRDISLLTNPEAFPLPHSEYFQYFSGWPSGRGLENVGSYLRSRSLESDKPVLVVTLMGFRHGNTSVPILMRKDAHVRFITAWEGNDYAISQFPAWLRANTVLVLVEPMGTPVDFNRASAAGFHSTRVFTGPDFEGAGGYQIFEITGSSP